jgi:hypothetical protein
MRIVVLTIAFAWTSLFLYGQEAKPENEPPIPVYIVQEKSPAQLAHYDSLAAAHDSQVAALTRKHEVLQNSMAQSLSQMDAQFLLLFLVAAVLCIACIMLYIANRRIKKQFTAVQQTFNEIMIPKINLLPEAVQQPVEVPKKRRRAPVRKSRRPAAKKSVRKKKK